MIKEQEPMYLQIIKDIKLNIIEGHYRKGDLLPTEHKLMSEYGVSRVTVREALKQLGEEGITESVQGKGTILLMDKDDLLSDSKVWSEFRNQYIEITNARILIEPSIAARVALSATDEQLKTLYSYVNKDAKEDIFHHYLLEIVNNSVVSDWFRTTFKIENKLLVVHASSDMDNNASGDEVKSQHMKIYEAIARHDPERAAIEMASHLEFILDLYVKYFDRIKK